MIPSIIKSRFFYKTQVILFLLCQLKIAAQLKSSEETITTTVEYTMPNYQSNLVADNGYSSIMTYKGITFFVWVDENFFVHLGKIKDGTVSSARLDEGNDWKVLDDVHHKFSLGVDKDGYIHLVGDMHNYPTSPSSLIQLPDRYLNKRTLYWVSKTPFDITNFEFVGDKTDTRGFPGFGFTYMSFKKDRNGILYARARGRVKDARGHFPGEMISQLFVYSTDSKTWKARGALPPTTTYEENSIYKGILWEDNGHNFGTDQASRFYQGYTTDFVFDLNNRLHFVSPVNNNSEKENSTHIVYAYSDDGGQTFSKADNTNLSLPLRVGEQSIDIVSGPSEFFQFTTIAYDKNNMPVVTYTEIDKSAPYNFAPSSFKFYDVTQNNWSGQITSPVKGLIRNKPMLDRNGIFTFIAADASGRIKRCASVNEEGYDHYLGGALLSIDEEGILEQGVLRGMFLKDGKLQILKVKITPNLKPLPSPWETVTIGNSVGESGSFYDVYHMNSSGNGQSDQEMNLQFINQELSGDFSIEARVMNIEYVTEKSFAGLMVANSLNEDSIRYSSTITTGNGFNIESKNDLNEFEKVNKGKHVPSEWIKITREGTNFTTYRSDNGIDWVFMDTRNIVMNNNVFIGMIAGSGNTDIGAARFDNLTIKTFSPNLLTNGHFDSGKEDWFFWNDKLNTNAYWNTENQQAVVTIDDGGESFSLAQLYRIVTLSENKSYKISFKAKSDVARTIQLKIIQNTLPYTTMHEKSFQLSTSYKTYDMIFENNEFSSDRRMLFALGKIESIVRIDDVVLSEIETNNKHFNHYQNLEESSNKEILVTPNPARDIVNINLSVDLLSDIILYDFQGRVLIDKYDLKGNTQLNLKEIPNGYYILKIMNKEGVSTKKMIIEK